MKRALGIFGAALVLAAAAPAQHLGLTVGEPLPDLELPTIDGAGSVRLSELRGTALLLIQFASW